MLKAILMSSAAVLVVASPALAQEAQPAEAETGIQDIVVTARRVSESAQKTPVAITAFNSSQLEAKVVQQATDLQFLTPSLQLFQPSTSPTGLYAQLRGQSATTTDANQPGSVGFYIDDIYYGGSNVAGGLINVTDLERVEVLKGPQGTLYGRNVTGGLIKFVTKKPTDRFEAYLKAGVGNYSRRTLEGMVNIPLAEGLSFRLNAQTLDRDGYGTDVVTKRQYDDDHRWNIRGAIKAEFSPNFELLVEGWYGKGHSNGVDGRTSYVDPTNVNAIKNIIASQRIDGFTPATTAALSTSDPAYAAAKAKALALVDTYFNAPRSEVHQPTDARLFPSSNGRSAGAAMTFAWTLGDITLRSITAYTEAERNSYSSIGGGPWMPNFGQQTGKVNQLSQEFQATGKALDGRLNFAAGLYLLRQKIQDNRVDNNIYGSFAQYLGQLGTGVTNNSRTLNHSQVTSVAPYAQASLEVIDGIKVSGGLRYTDDHVRMTTRQISFTGTGGNPGLGVPPFGAFCNTATLALTTPLDACEATDKTSYSNWSYLAGIDWQIAPGIMIYAKRVRGFKSGGINGYGSGPGPFVHYGPESNTDHEVGLKTEFLDRRIRFNVDYYHTDYNNIQRTVTTIIFPGPPPQFATGIQNAASATIQGVEAELTLVPAEGLTLSASGAWTTAKYNSYTTFNSAYPNNIQDLSTEAFQGVPKYTYTLSASYVRPVSFGKLRLSTDFAWRDDFYAFAHDVVPAAPGGPVTPDRFLVQKAYGLLNGSLTLDIDKYDTSITLWGRNLANKRYVENTVALVTTGLGYTWSTFGAPRTYGLDITKRF